MEPSALFSPEIEVLGVFGTVINLMTVQEVPFARPFQAIILFSFGIPVLVAVKVLGNLRLTSQVKAVINNDYETVFGRWIKVRILFI